VIIPRLVLALRFDDPFDESVWSVHGLIGIVLATVPSAREAQGMRKKFSRNAPWMPR
jgi:hypothetical protein